MEQLIPIIIMLPLIGFWFWMLWDMTNNDRLPSNSTPTLTWPPTSKLGWMLIFVVLNVFGAAFYYVEVYRNKNY